jgi:hypothetical protein
MIQMTLTTRRALVVMAIAALLAYVFFALVRTPATY